MISNIVRNNGEVESGYGEQIKGFKGGSLLVTLSLGFCGLRRETGAWKDINTNGETSVQNDLALSQVMWEAPTYSD